MYRFRVAFFSHGSELFTKYLQILRATSPEDVDHWSKVQLSP
jgi:hypothetical protein